MQKRIQRALYFYGIVIFLSSCEHEFNYYECPEKQELREFMSQIDNRNITPEQQEIIDEITLRYEECVELRTFN